MDERVIYQTIHGAISDGLRDFTDRVAVDRRDRFAAAALTGLFSYYGRLPTGMAQWAVASADALIAELDKPRK